MTTKIDYTNTKHSNTIAEVLGEQIEYRSGGGYCIDRYSRCYKATCNHSGFILDGINTDVYIPYWTSYKISIPDLQVIKDPDPYKSITPCVQEYTVDYHLQKIGIIHKMLVKDRANIVWQVFVYDDGHYELHNYFDNGWLHSRTCELISLGYIEGFTK
jgi:hypothetical protein